MKNEWNGWKYSVYRNAWRFDGPPHEEQQLDKEAYSNLLRIGGLLVRNTYGFDGQEETCFWYIIKDQYEGLEGLSSRTRNKIHHAFDHFEYRLIPFETLQEKGYQIIDETYADYPVHDRKMNQDIFMDYLNDCRKKSFDYWGIFDKETQQMVGFCTVTLWDNCCEYGMTGILSKYKKGNFYPYYGLYQHLNQHYLKEVHFKYVSDSARTITEHSQIQDFLCKTSTSEKPIANLRCITVGG